MLKLFVVVVLVQVLSQVHSFSPTFNENNELCVDAVCTDVGNCQQGEYLSWKRPNEGKCCQTCEPYAKYGEQCNAYTQCGRNLYCPFPPNGKYSPDDVCVYPWENMKYQAKCDTSHCPTYQSCPENYFLMKHDGEQTCCDQCIQYSVYGDYCDEKLPCVSGLKCNDNICTASEKCLEEKSNCKVIDDCGENNYLKTANGLDRCCDECQSYAKQGEECDYRDAICGLNSYCDYSTGRCVESKFDCSQYPCSALDKESDCKGVWVPADGVNICCPYCIPYANYGSYCDEKNLCNPDVFICQNNTCAVKECNCV